jgi:hypothetical protein
MSKNPDTNSINVKNFKVKKKKWSKMLTQAIAFIDCSDIILSGNVVFWRTFLHASVLYSFVMAKFLPKTCRLKNGKHEFVKIWSKAESSRKSFGNFEAKDVH